MPLARSKLQPLAQPMCCSARYRACTYSLLQQHGCAGELPAVNMPPWRFMASACSKLTVIVQKPGQTASSTVHVTSTLPGSLGDVQMRMPAAASASAQVVGLSEGGWLPAQGGPTAQGWRRGGGDRAGGAGGAGRCSRARAVRAAPGLPESCLSRTARGGAPA